MANYIIVGGDNKEYGPVSDAEVRLWISEGRLSAESRMKAESDAEFRTLAQFPEFAEALKPQTTPSVIASVGENDASWESTILARETELRFDECLAAGWSFLAANSGFLAGAVLMYWIVNLVLVFISVVIPIIGPIAVLCLHGVLIGGFYWACLRRARGESVSPVEVFAGFKTAFPQLLLTGLVSVVLSELAACCFLLPYIYLAVAWVFAPLLVINNKMQFWQAMELSRKVVTRVWFEMFALILVMFLPLVIYQTYSSIYMAKYFIEMWDKSGHDFQQLAQMFQAQMADFQTMGMKSMLLTQIVLLVNLFFVPGVIVRAYENLFGPRKP